MNKEISISPDIVKFEKIETAEPTQKTTSFSEEDRCEGEVERDLTDALHQSESSSQGTMASNTVPPNDKNKHFKALLFGIDSLFCCARFYTKRRGNFKRCPNLQSHFNALAKR